MAEDRFSLSWDAHNKTLCNGLYSLQQNDQFVDMTLAADGHYVKVHQVIMFLASPYIRKHITTVQCPHPVIFLKKISYTTLCSLVEYIYNGEVVIAKDNLAELIRAGKQLHVKELEDMKLEISTEETIGQWEHVQDVSTSSCDDFELNDETFDDETFDDETFNGEMADIDRSTHCTNHTEDSKAQIQYLVTCRGAIHMILNRLIYYLRPTKRGSERSAGRRRWRCATAKCPAVVHTLGDKVCIWDSVHAHGFHDKQIWRKVQDSAVYSTIEEAEAIQRRNWKLYQNMKLAKFRTMKYVNGPVTEGFVQPTIVCVKSVTSE